MTDMLHKFVRNCARCRSEHEVEYHEFDRPLPDVDGAFTHWATCPNSGDPILMRITPEGGYRMPTGRIIVLAYELEPEGTTSDAWKPLTTEQMRSLVRRKPSTILPVGENVWIAYDGVKL